VDSKVYNFAETKVNKTESGLERYFFNGSTTHFANMKIYATTLQPEKNVIINEKQTDNEVLVIVKDGELKMTLNDKSKVVAPGSVALIMPEDMCELENESDSLATYYIVKYKSKSPVNIARGKMAGASELYDWDKLEFRPHDRGGVRSYFDRKSSMSDRIEMHVTTLNPQIKSHEPHTHEPAEIVIMMEGTTEMEIGNNLYQGTVGDIYFLGSDIPHAIRNTGDKACMYMAFQWE